LYQGLTQAGISSDVATRVANLPPTGALFAAFLGYNPMRTILPAAALQQLPAASQALLLGKTFFPNLIAAPFDDGLRLAFSISVVLAVIAALASLLRGKRVIYGQESEPMLVPSDLDSPAPLMENEDKITTYTQPEGTLRQ
jgi:hypothetical protein